jgi:hypothetical protein
MYAQRRGGNDKITQNNFNEQIIAELRYSKFIISEIINGDEIPLKSKINDITAFIFRKVGESIGHFLAGDNRSPPYWLGRRVLRVACIGLREREGYWAWEVEAGYWGGMR